MNATQTQKVEFVAGILAACEDIPSDVAVGLRCVPEEVEVGQLLSPSYHWADGEPTDVELPGTSAINLRSGSQLDCPVTGASVHEAIRLVDQYIGEGYAVVIGQYAGSGEDRGEILIEDATVVACWELPSL